MNHITAHVQPSKPRFSLGQLLATPGALSVLQESGQASDRPTLRKHYGAILQENALPSLQDMESRLRHAIQEALVHATRNCKNAYQKGKRSFEVLEKLRPEELRRHLPSFARCEHVLKRHLNK